jgi:hypothetical protein
MGKHIQILAILNIIWGSLGVLGALIVLAVFGGVTTIIRLAGGAEPGAELAIPIVGTVGGLVFLVLIVTSAPSIVAGIALLKFKEWARILALVVSALHLFSIPFGTALGIYGLWVLLSQESIALFHSRERAVRIGAENP